MCLSQTPGLKGLACSETVGMEGVKKYCSLRKLVTRSVAVCEKGLGQPVVLVADGCVAGCWWWCCCGVTDLGLFSTKSLVEANPDHEVEVRTQVRTTFSFHLFAVCAFVVKCRHFLSAVLYQNLYQGVIDTDSTCKTCYKYAHTSSQSAVCLPWQMLQTKDQQQIYILQTYIANSFIQA